MPTDIGRYFSTWKFLYELDRILIEYVSVNVKLKRILAGASADTSEDIPAAICSDK